MGGGVVVIWCVVTHSCCGALGLDSLSSVTAVGAHGEALLQQDTLHTQQGAHSMQLCREGGETRIKRYGEGVALMRERYVPYHKYSRLSEVDTHTELLYTHTLSPYYTFTKRKMHMYMHTHAHYYTHTQY